MEFNLESLISAKFPVEGTYDIVNATSNVEFSSVLDIGFGSGGASTYFALEGKKVTAIGLEVESYNYPKELLDKFDVTILETTFEDFQSEEKYDAIWASHVLEHSLNVGFFLNKCKELLTDQGWLFICVPLYKDNVVGGHVSNGWNIGQLMYNLLLTGFDIKNGHFIHHGYSVCGFVQKAKTPLPNLRMDIGDIETTSEFWPIEAKQGFSGMIKEVNWFADFRLFENGVTRVKTLESELSKSREQLRQLGEKVELQQNKILELDNKNKESSRKNFILQKDLENLTNFNSLKVEQLLASVKEEVFEEKKLLSDKPISKKNKRDYFNIYRSSALPKLLQPIKRVPILGSLLLWMKRDVVGWG